MCLPTTVIPPSGLHLGTPRPLAECRASEDPADFIPIKALKKNKEMLQMHHTEMPSLSSQSPAAEPARWAPTSAPGGMSSIGSDTAGHDGASHAARCSITSLLSAWQHRHPEVLAPEISLPRCCLCNSRRDSSPIPGILFLVSFL